MNPLPFRMRTDTPLEQWRADTWMQKEPETVAWIESFPDDCVFYDIGANVGVYSMLCAALHPHSIIIAFEPFPSNYASLLYNIGLNRFGNIFPFCAAVGGYDNESLVTFFSASTEIGSSGGQAGVNLLEVRRKSVALGISIDKAIPDFQMPHPDYVKIDVDGQELEIVKGMAGTLHLVKSILVEVSKATKQPIVDILTAAGFSMENRFNTMSPHSRERREATGSDAENIIFTR